MLTKEENELLTQTGPETAAGNLMRRYWQPVALAWELPEDGAPIPIKLLGEDLVLYRDGKGQLGLLGRWCTHRGMDLAHGYNEEEGLRCAWHGWIYDREGNCLDQPMEPEGQKFNHEIHHKAYPCLERSDFIFAYLGPGEPPLLPEYECFSLDPAHRATAKYRVDCNYLQALEGNVDPAQVALLSRVVQGAESAPPIFPDSLGLDVQPEETNFGVRVFAVQEAEEADRKLAVRNFVMPNLCLVPANGFDGGVVHWHVPIDDTHHWRYVLAYRRDAPITEEEARRNGVEQTEDYRPPTEREHLYQSYIAYATILAESQGPILDRTQESLADGDRGIVALRSAIYGGIEDVLEGADPAHVLREGDETDFRSVAAVERAVSREGDWREAWYGAAPAESPAS
jgi:phthalate 4,5-dioxygenase